MVPRSTVDLTKLHSNQPMPASTDNKERCGWMLQKTRRTHSRLIVGWSVVSLATQETCLLSSRQLVAATPQSQFTGGASLSCSPRRADSPPHDPTPQLDWSKRKGEGPEDHKGGDPRTDQVTKELPHNPRLASRRDRYLVTAACYRRGGPGSGPTRLQPTATQPSTPRNCGVGTPRVIRHH